MSVGVVVVALIVFALLTVVFMVLWFLSGKPHSDGEPGPYSSPSFQSPQVVKESLDHPARSREVPDVFNPARIKSDLEVLANQPTLLGQYIAKAELRFTQATHIAVLEGWTRFYHCGKEVIEARTNLARAHNAFLQVEMEGAIAAKQKEVVMAKLDADKEEHETRKVRSISERSRTQTLESDQRPKSEDDIRLDAAQEHDRRDIRYSVRRDVGKKLTTLKELHQWYKDERKVILADDTLTPEEQDEQYAQLKQSYDDYKSKLKIDPGIYEDED